jgi:hypothetical protein
MESPVPTRFHLDAELGVLGTTGGTGGTGADNVLPKRRTLGAGFGAFEAVCGAGVAIPDTDDLLDVRGKNAVAVFSPDFFGV